VTRPGPGGGRGTDGGGGRPADGAEDADDAGSGGPERRALEALDEGLLVSLLEDLVAVQSLGGEPGEREAQERVAARMEELGLAVDAWEIDFRKLRRHPAYSSDLEREKGLGVVGSLGHGGDRAGRGGDRDGVGGDRDGRTLVLNGHVDVVPAGEESRWSVPPFSLTRRGDRLLGRGTADMKGALAAALAAVAAVREAGIELAGRLEIHSVVAEEDGGAGTLAALERGHGRAEGAVVMEPTRLAVAPAQAGALNFRITVPGAAAHGALREEGVDPVEKLLPVFRAVRALEAERNHRLRDALFSSCELPYAICIGKVRAGVWASTVAETLVAEGRFGIAPGEDVDTARKELETAVARTASGDAWLADHPPEVEWWGAQFEPARTDPDADVVRAVRRAHRDVSGREPEVRGMTYGADMRLLANVGGVPTLLYGPGDVREAHRPDESVELDELITAAKVYALLALRFCGTAPPSAPRQRSLPRSS